MLLRSYDWPKEVKDKLAEVLGSHESYRKQHASKLALNKPS